ncbi:phosphotriesterase family protein [Alicyclobacillus macrosporangiidus]|uniref:Phosphotriesterase-related protein n=1 Tax=Alicyclobacillus macrosporangiidus TaxID=392015 RepID=A0A1I7L9R7_9BACL|nr:phosphotriesterase [Alicyclobacillus macrosporangiidus]SFV06224.1 phosphotriesterase-related protein [Alicyclobacillus macrosporangiidus]
MGFVRTVLGDVEPTALQATMIHEHITFDLSHVRKETDSVLSDSPELVRELEMPKVYGCNTFVEVTNRGMGRNVLMLAELARRLGVHIVCSTGYYKESVYPAEVFEKSRSELADLFVSEITVGIDGTDIRAGIISEIGSSYEELTEAEEKVFRAACDAQKRTGAPLSTHCELGTMGLAQLRIFESEHVDLRRISFGHQDLNRNFEEQVTLLANGAFLQFDTIGKNSYRPHEERVANLVALLDKGYEDQLMLSVDLTRKSYFRQNDGPGYVYLFDRFLPDLRAAGVPEAILDKMLVQNPRRFLAFNKG